MPHVVSEVIPVSCGSGFMFFWLPWVVVVVVVVCWNFSCFSFLPEVVVSVSHTTDPCILSQFSGSGAANAAGAESATTKRAAVNAKLIRLIILYPFSTFTQHL